jgi:hypothetical protein
MQSLSSPRLQAGSQYAVSKEGIFMHAALSEDMAQHKKARWLTPAIFAILPGTLIFVFFVFVIHVHYRRLSFHFVLANF